MRHQLGKAVVILLLGAASVMLAGCFDLMGKSVDNQTAADPGPGPGPGPQNSAPTISGSPPPAVVVGSNYSFTPTASDPDGDPLTFAVQNKPSWATFSSSTGAISGVATLGSEGMYANIGIEVSDGQLASSLPRFSVEVTQRALGSATLSWLPPTQNADGSPLMDLAGFRIYYGNSQGSYPNVITINNPGLSSYVVENLVPNVYFFVSTSINSTGGESNFSNVANKTIN